MLYEVITDEPAPDIDHAHVARDGRQVLPRARVSNGVTNYPDGPAVEHRLVDRGEQSCIGIELTRRRHRDSVSVGSIDEECLFALAIGSVDVITSYSIHYTKLYEYYPLGLLRAWTWVDLDAKAIVYPQPIFGAAPDASARQRDEGVLVDPKGSDDFNDMRNNFV